MSDNIKVAVAAIFGAGSPTANWFLNLEPTLDVVLTVCQILVAIITAIYIFTKWRNARKNKSSED